MKKELQKETSTSKQLKAFRVSFIWHFNSGEHTQEETIFAKTASKARYKFYEDNLSESFSYDMVFRWIKSTVVKKPSKSDFYEEINTETLEYRNIEFAHLGMNVEFLGRKGFIIGTTNSCNLSIMSHDFTERWVNHPHWKMKYFDDNGNLIKNYGVNNG